MTRAVIAAIAVVICMAYLSGGARGIGVSDRDRVFSPADSADIQLAMPARDVPIDNLPTLSNLSGRFALTIALGRRSALRDLAAVAGALAIGLFGAWLSAIGIPLFITALAMLCMAVSPTFWGRGISWSFDALTPALALLALWSATRWFATRRRAFAALAAIAAVAALFDWRLDVIDTVTAPSLAPVFQEFTPLGTFVAAIGLVLVLSSSRPRLLVGLIWLCVAVLMTFGSIRTFDELSPAVAVGGWTAFAIGLAWIHTAIARRTGLALIGVVVLMVVAEPTLTRERFWALGRDLPSEVRTRLAADVRPVDLPDNAAIIAEAHRADVMLRLEAAMSRRQLPYLPQVPDRIRASADQGTTLLAFDNARANLERLGFVFEREFIGNTEMSLVSGYSPCLDLRTGEWHDVSLLIASGSFVLHGSTPGAAPGGVVLRTPREPAQVAAIEPRSIPFEVHDTGIRVPATGRRDPVIVTLAASPAIAEATAEDGPPVRMCAGVLREPLMLGRAANASASLRMNDSAPFAAGWHPLEADPDFFRWTAAPEALVRVSLAPPGPIRVTLTASPAARASQKPSIGLIVNRCRLPQQSMQAGQGDYEWSVDAACWRSGMNHLWIAVTPLISPATLFKTHDNRLLGARIGAIRLARQ